MESLESGFNSLIHKELPFVVYKKPDNRQITSIQQQDNELNCVSDYTESGFVFAPFNSSKKSILFPFDESIIKKYSYGKLKLPIKKVEPIYDKKAHNIHLGLVKKGIESIAKTEMCKVVLSRKHTLSHSISSFDAFNKMLANYPSAFVYCWFHPAIGMWLGATPETLLQINNRKLTTIALAGTQSFKGDMDVQWGAKEIEEQRLVMASIVENLQLFTGNSLTVSDTRTSKAGTLLHLKTNISATIDNAISVKDIISALHPTPAVCGFPKKLAEDFIFKNEEYDREYYSGFLGELNLTKKRNRARTRRNIENLAYSHITKHTSLYVNLRCMQWEGNLAHLYVGGGITIDSNPELEWQETQNKLQTMLSIL